MGEGRRERGRAFFFSSKTPSLSPLPTVSMIELQNRRESGGRRGERGGVVVVGVEEVWVGGARWIFSL